MIRMIPTVVAAGLAFGACAEEPPAPTTPGVGQTLIKRVDDALVAVDARSGRSLQRTPLGAADPEARAVYSAEIDPVAGETAVTATDPADGKVLRSTVIRGRWVIPVAAGRTPDGALSGDGATLALAGPSGEGTSHFALLPTDLESPPQRFRLRGRFDFDALSPDASAVFLSEIRGDGRYRVRAYDVVAGKLRPQVVVEKTSLGLIMQGLPVARAVDPTGSPVHTLYRGGPMGAFVHSLDTARGTALCIFLPKTKKAGSNWLLRLRSQSELHALDRDRDAHYVIDPQGGAVTEGSGRFPAAAVLARR